MVIKMGRFGKFLACPGFPECSNEIPHCANCQAASEPAKPAPTTLTFLACLFNWFKVTLLITTNNQLSFFGIAFNMVIKMGRFGKFLACPGFPECSNAKPLLEKINVTCPQCHNGEVVLRRSKKGRTFYGCSGYPECSFVASRTT